MNPEHTATAHALEAKRHTHDGMIWPKSRFDMTVGCLIRQRMLEDLTALIQQYPGRSIMDSDLNRLGWTMAQVSLNMHYVCHNYREKMAKAEAARAKQASHAKQQQNPFFHASKKRFCGNDDEALMALLLLGVAISLTSALTLGALLIEAL